MRGDGRDRRRAQERAVGRALLALAAAALIAIAGPAAAQSGPPARYFGVVDQDGCPFCCEFSCRLTPTPTPEVDAHGRRVFRRSSGNFLVVAEAGIGTSRRQPGSEGVFTGSSVQPITGPSGRPSLQALSNRNLGKGVLGVDCRSVPDGGVKGFPDEMDFPSDPDVTTELIDMACRFELQPASMSACTRNRFGDFAFLAPGTARQYCFQVPGAARFPFGDTILALQFLDTNGDVGPRQEIVIRVSPEGAPVASSTPTPTPTPTPTIANIAGRVRYYSADRPVPGALVQLSDGALRSTASNGSGAYAFPNLMPGNVIVEPRKTGDFGPAGIPAITALDASWVLQMVAGTRSFDASQRLAGDVTGDGTVSSLDAARILQRQVGLLGRFAVSTLCNSDWVFRPVPGPATNQRSVQPQVGQGLCRRGAIALEPLVGDAMQQDFLGVLFGDCTGNWQPAPSGAALRALAVGAQHTLRVRSARPAGGGTLRVPLAVKGSDSYYALDLTFTYDPDLLTPDDRPQAARRGRGDGGVQPDPAGRRAHRRGERAADARRPVSDRHGLRRHWHERRRGRHPGAGRRSPGAAQPLTRATTQVRPCARSLRSLCGGVGDHEACRYPDRLRTALPEIDTIE